MNKRGDNILSRFKKIGGKIIHNIAIIGNIILVIGVFIILYSLIDPILLGGNGEILVVIISGIFVFSFCYVLDEAFWIISDFDKGFVSWIGMILLLVFIIIITYAIRLLIY